MPAQCTATVIIIINNAFVVISLSFHKTFDHTNTKRSSAVSGFGSVYIYIIILLPLVCFYPSFRLFLALSFFRPSLFCSLGVSCFMDFREWLALMYWLLQFKWTKRTLVIYPGWMHTAYTAYCIHWKWNTCVSMLKRDIVLCTYAYMFACFVT